jgi:urea transporter
LALALPAIVSALLRSYAQILFTRRRVVGVAVLVATLVHPIAALLGVVGAAVALLVARGIGFGRGPIEDGLYGYNAVLVGLTLGAMFEPTAPLLGWVCVAAAMTTLLTAALRSLMGAVWSIPLLSMPVLLVVVWLIPAGTHLGLVAQTWKPLRGFLPAAVSRWELAIDGLGAIVLAPEPLSAALIVIALTLYSRIALSLAITGLVVVGGMLAALPMALDPISESLLFANGALVAVALGGVWFVPSASSFGLAVGGAVVSTGLGLGLTFVLLPLNLPLLVFPFNLTVLSALAAMRQRSRDQSPKSVDFLLGTPEENLRFARTRIARFGAHYSVRFQAPFLGSWTCTQGSNDGPTHLGPWKDAADFEITTTTTTGEFTDTSSARVGELSTRSSAGADEFHRGSGHTLADYGCYHLPVLAPADGTVLRVIDGIRDNIPGEVNLDHSWGNVVMVLHAPGLVSVLAHLSPGSIKVHEGEVLRRGQQVATCGASGRAPRPHLHFQLQGSHLLGAPTLPNELHDVVVEEGGRSRLVSTLEVRSGDVVRNLEVDERLVRALRLPWGQTMQWQGSCGPETVRVDVDLMGQHTLRAEPGGATLYFDPGAHLFTVFDVIDVRRSRPSVLQLWQAALGRVPMEVDHHVEWTDVLPIDFLRSPLFSALNDFVAPFAPMRGVKMAYVVVDNGAEFVVRGRAADPSQRSIETEAVISLNRGVCRVRVTIDGTTFFAERLDPDHHHCPTGASP